MAARPRCIRAALTALALAAGLGLVAAAPASADTNTYGDAVGEEGTEPWTDIVAYRLTLDATNFALTLRTRGPAVGLPARRLYVRLDTDGDDSDDFQATYWGEGWG